jgi:hypothetical protein
MTKSKGFCSTLLGHSIDDDAMWNAAVAYYDDWYAKALSRKSWKFKVAALKPRLV